MRVLLTNDDGIRAPGIGALFDALADVHGVFGKPIAEEIVPIAPLTVQSATSHGVTFHEPLMIRDEQVNQHMRGIAVDGRPADCVKVAVASLWPERFGSGDKPDLLISGMNAGANCGINVIYSGTVAAALEAAFLGIPSIAVSLHLGEHEPDFAKAAEHARRAVEMVLGACPGGLPEKHECININIPRTEVGNPEHDAMPPVRVCAMNTHGLMDSYERRVSPTGGVYYWASGHGLDFHATDDGSDVQLLMDRCITVTPLQYDLTRHEHMREWTDRLSG